MKKFILKNYEKYWYIDVHGDLHFKIIDKKENSFIFAKNTAHLFETKEEAKRYKEFLTDIYDLGKEFIDGEENYYFYYNYHSKGVLIYYDCVYKSSHFYFTKENGEKLLNKYGEDYIKNYLLNVWD